MITYRTVDYDDSNNEAIVYIFDSVDSSGLYGTLMESKIHRMTININLTHLIITYIEDHTVVINHAAQNTRRLSELLEWLAQNQERTKECLQHIKSSRA